MKLELILALVVCAVGVGLATAAGWLLFGPAAPLAVGVALVAVGVLVEWERLT